MKAVAPPDEVPEVDFEVGSPPSGKWETEWVADDPWEAEDDDEEVNINKDKLYAKRHIRNGTTRCIMCIAYHLVPHFIVLTGIHQHSDRPEKACTSPRARARNLCQAYGCHA